jgi:hypothetical protein
MPQHVLESALEAVSRTTQVGRKNRLGVPWLNQRFVVLAVAAVVAVLAVIAVPRALENLERLFGPQPGIGPEASEGGALIWDPAADFLDSPNQMNPSPDSYGNANVWSYMRSANATHNPAQYFLLPNFHVVSANADEWYERDLVNLLVAHSRADSVVSMHPWGGGPATDSRRFAILAWTSPIAGEVSVIGAVEAQATCGAQPADGHTFSIDRGDQTLESLRIHLGEGAGFEFRTTVAIGESLYFIVDPMNDSRCDLALLTLAITHE